MSDSLSGMKKVNSPQFPKQFSKLASNLKPSQTGPITKHGKPFVQVVKRGKHLVKMPDFAKNLRDCGFRKSVGNKMLKELYDSLS